ncbi:MAG TPA: phospholipase D family protein [Lachnospiraceae bacterium]|nr:phospholipase D family protein [Lachnospiraceae bacterium]
MKIVKRILVILLVLIVYEVVGMLVPFAKMKSISEMYRKEVDINRFYAEEDSQTSQRACVVETNQEALSFRLDLFERAKESIILSTFDIRPGKSTDDLFAALYAAADRGVQVQILVDGMYGLLHMTGEDIFLAAGIHPNIEIRFYNIPNLLMPWTIHGRMHDKYILVDQEYLLMGGRNTFDYFIGDYTRSKGYDREVFVMSDAGEEDSAVQQVSRYFQNMWENEACRTVYDTRPAWKKEKLKKEVSRLLTHYNDMEQKGQLEELSYQELTVAIEKATLLTNPTHIFGKEPYIFEELRQLMLSAEERVMIHTPYIVCSEEMYRGLTEVAEAVPDSRMIVNSIEAGDNVCASSDYLRHRDEVLETGFRLYEYMGDHSTHGKSLLVDDDISVIGSYNFDNRSTYVDTETMLVIDSRELNEELYQKLKALKEQSLEVDAKGNYIETTDVVPKEMDLEKKSVIRFLSVLIQGVRYLI